MRRHAHDMVVDHFEFSGLDPDFEVLGDADRAAFLAEMADSLADGLLCYIGYWIINDFQLVGDWLKARP